HVVLDAAGDEDDALLQEARENVISPLTPVGLLDHHRNEVVIGRNGISHGPLLHAAQRRIALFRNDYIVCRPAERSPRPAAVGRTAQLRRSPRPARPCDQASSSLYRSSRDTGFSVILASSRM